MYLSMAIPLVYHLLTIEVTVIEVSILNDDFYHPSLLLFIWCLHSNEVASSFQPNQNLYVFFSLQIRNQFSEWKPHTIDIWSKHLKTVARHLLQCHCPSSPEYRMDRARCQQAYHLIHWLFPCFWIAIGFEKQTIKIQTVIRRSSHILALIGTFGFF